ncbi:MAG TPA: YdcF family protein [Longimicrobiales bacterium]|nr:YdcF family protein [Longimicrobiales bacterium]
MTVRASVASAAPAGAGAPALRRGARTRLRRAAGAVGLLVLLLLGLYLARRTLLTAVGRSLVVSEAPRAADAILVLNGSPFRSVRAAQLLHAGYAPRVMIVRGEPLPPVLRGIQPQETDMAVAVLRREGVPDSAIQVIVPPRPVTSTREETTAFAAFARDHAIRRVLLVTSEFHSRRARWTLRHVPGGDRLEVVSTPIRDWAFGPEDWWHHERGLINVAEEALKFVYYLGS